MADITRPKYTRFGVLPLLLAPFPFLLIPDVFLVSILFGLTIAGFIIYSIIFASVLAPPPHLWNAQNIGLLPVSSLIGMIIGLPIGALFADMLSQRQTKLANGENNPRSRLPLIILGFLISPTGLVISGYCLRPEHFSWIGFAVGLAMLGSGLTSSSNIVTTYCVDSFRTKAGHIGVVINVVKNSIGFGVSYAAIPWYTKQGPVSQFGTMVGLLWASYLRVIPLYFYYKQVTMFSERLIAKLGI